MTCTTTAPVSTAGTAWLDLERTCEAAIDLSRRVAAHIGAGARAGDYLPLLREQLALADEVRSRIARLGGLGPDPGAGERRQRVIDQLVELLDLEQGNQKLLARRGSRLTGRPRTGAPHRMGS
ncbi:MAG: hypothetical protein ABIL09_04145 [Gemmatimonadota bacterium]